jgi:ABC-type nickel/cobalt efflux system permease component RcnA
MSRRTLVAMGVAGGMVPSPSALVVLLGAIALGRAWFGVVLVVGYGLGMAFTLTAAGLLLVRARGILDRRETTTSSGPSRLAVLARAMPAVTATVIVSVGLFLAVQGASRI